MIDSLEAQKLIAHYRPANAVVIATMTTNMEWPQASTNPSLDLPFTGAMGKASSVGLGIALARPNQKVIVLDGDGSLLMNLGSLITVANMAPRNFVHFVFDNGMYRTTGGQPVPGAGKHDFAALAKAAGYAKTYEFDEASALVERIEHILGESGPTLVCLKVAGATERPPYPLTATPRILERFKAGLAQSS